MTLVDHPTVPAGTVKDLVAVAKVKPGTINFASSSSGSTAHLAAELFKSMAGVNIMHVPYKGVSPALTDLVGGQVQIMFTGVSSTLPYVKSNRLEPLAVSGEKRIPVMPSIPKMAQEIASFELVTWYGVFAPTQTAKPVIVKLNQTRAKIFATADARQRLAALGAEPVTLSPEQFGTAVAKETAKWAKVIRDSGARPE